jgi:hypothetical protein
LLLLPPRPLPLLLPLLSRSPLLLLLLLLLMLLLLPLLPLPPCCCCCCRYHHCFVARAVAVIGLYDFSRPCPSLSGWFGVMYAHISSMWRGEMAGIGCYIWNNTINSALMTYFNPDASNRRYFDTNDEGDDVGNGQSAGEGSMAQKHQ